MYNQLFNKKEHKNIRQRLRNAMPIAEQKFWYMVRGNILGYKFRRQQGIGPYIVDFYCPRAKLAIEIDGESYYWKDRKWHEHKRNAFLCSKGIRVLRFTNNDILQNMNEVFSSVVKIVQQK